VFEWKRCFHVKAYRIEKDEGQSIDLHDALVYIPLHTVELSLSRL